MNKFYNFQDFINEEFSQVGVAPEGNMVGMGDVTPPSSSNIGSGDMWPSLGKPYSLIPLKKKRKVKKRKSNDKKVNYNI